MELFRCRRRILWLLVVLGAAVFFLGGKLFYVQVWRGPLLARMAVQQRLQGVVMLEGRGDIQDRHGRSLLDGRSSLGLLAFPAQYRGREEEIIGSLAALRGIERIASPPHGSLPFWVIPSLDKPLPAAFESLPGLVPAVRTERYGPGTLASHLVGYIRESEGRGVSGLELAFDRELSLGQQALLAAVVDGQSRIIPGIGYRVRKDEPISKNVVTALDRNLQQAVERIMDRRVIQGAAVVMDPWNGDILALASRPGFSAASLAEHLERDRDSLINRALWEYQPGSVFKTIVVAAALEEGLVSLFQTFRCPGGIEVEGLYIPCSYLHGKPVITLVEAFAHSCNTVFISLALELGPEKLHACARALGFGELTGLPVGERAGNIPAAAELAAPRALANSAIGQGAVLTTPLQVASMMAVIANGGRTVRPRLVLALTDGFGRETRRFLPRRGDTVLSPGTVNKLKYLLQQVMEEGTGRQAALAREPAGAKTGTAQSGRMRNGKEVLNYWIAGFYPLEKTRAVIVVFADEMREGTVARVFGEIAACLDQQ